MKQTSHSDSHSCICDVQEWTFHDKLQLDEDKTDDLLLTSSKSSDLPSSLKVGQHDNHLYDSARNLGVMFDSSFSKRKQVSNVGQRAYFEVRRGSIIKYLTTQPMKTLVTSLVLSRLDYFNSPLARIPQNLLDKIQNVMNCAARLVFRANVTTLNVLLFCLICIGFLLVKECGIRFLLSATMLFLVLPLHTSLTCYSCTHPFDDIAFLCRYSYFPSSSPTQEIPGTERLFFFLLWPCHREQSSLCRPPCPDSPFF